MAQMKEHIKTPEKIQLSDEQIANLSDVQFKTLVIRMVREMIEYRHKTKEEVKTIQSEIKKNVHTGNQQRREPTRDSNQQFGTKGRNKHSTGTEWRNKNSKKHGEAQEPLGQL